MAVEGTTPDLTFERVNEGAQVFLSDRRVFRAGRDYWSVVAGWKSGARVTLSEDSNMIHEFAITNLDTGEIVRATRSADLSQRMFGDPLLK
jgi:hypothetical protein